MKRKKRSIHNLRTITREEQEYAIYLTNLRLKLGIQTIYDNSYSGGNKYIPSMYTSTDEYEYDKLIVDNLITMNKPIPQDLQNKLIAARIELESLGLLEPYVEIKRTDLWEKK